MVKREIVKLKGAIASYTIPQLQGITLDLDLQKKFIVLPYIYEF